MTLAFYTEQLICYALKFRLIEEEDKRVVRNQLWHFLGIKNPEKTSIINCPENISEILEPLMDKAFDEKILKSNLTTDRDLFETALMGILTPRPTQIINQFRYTEALLGVETATNWLYKLAKHLNYIQCARIAKNENWKCQTAFGELEITINLSKPEKDPKEIAEASKNPPSNYPLCVLCAENEGFAGSYNQAARQNHRLIPIELCNEKWFFQYSPYLYYNEHCIVLSEEHRPMKIDVDTFTRLLEFTQQFPHYFIGSNADLPIVGGSILSHDHFQGGKHIFAMAQAPLLYRFVNNKYTNLSIGIVNWPMSVIRLESENQTDILEAANEIFNAWKLYTNDDIEIRAFTENIPHNTITPIARRKKSAFQLDLVLRNNRADAQHPMGIFHPHEHLHHLKKENIGLIEVMGLAILPGRLKQEIGDMLDFIHENGLEKKYPHLEKHKHWIDELKAKHSHISESVIKESIGEKFIEVLQNAAVFKPNHQGQGAFIQFLTTINFHLIE